MWYANEDIARAMIDDRADREVKQRGLPVPMPNPVEAPHQVQQRWTERRLSHWLTLVGRHSNVACRWFLRHGLPSDCGQPVVRGV